jgi:hypothetical protein
MPFLLRGRPSTRFIFRDRNRGLLTARGGQFRQTVRGGGISAFGRSLQEDARLIATFRHSLAGDIQVGELQLRGGIAVLYGEP